jgi:WD40 repeat protein
MVISADGKTVVTAGGFPVFQGKDVVGSVDKVVHVWDAETGKEKFRLTGHPSGIGAVAISPDGKWIISSGAGSARLWDATTGETVHVFKTNYFTSIECAFSPDGRTAAVAMSNTVFLYDVENRREIRSLPVGGNIVFAPGGKELIVCRNGPPSLWDIRLGIEKPWQNAATAAWFARVSPDGKRLVLVGRDKKVDVFDIESGERLYWFSRPAQFVQPSHDGTRILVAQNNTVTVYEMRVKK